MHVVVQPLVHCVPADFHAGTMYITVFGRITSQFSLVVTTSSGSVTLVDGLPQQVETSLRTVGGGATGIDEATTLFTHSLFAAMQVCRERDAETGQCAGDSGEWKSAQVATFEFEVVGNVGGNGGLPPAELVISRICNAGGDDCDTTMAVRVPG